MKNIVSIITFTFITMGFNACGNGGDASFKDGLIKIPVTIECVQSPTTTDIDTYISLQGGDTIVKDEDNTTISTYHDTDGVKKICLVSGSAHIVR